MRKGERTREYILKQAAELFNQRGYHGSSLSDIMNATGLKKGGIYNHFENKDQIALEAFDYAVNVMKQVYANAIKGKSSCIEQLKALASVYEHIIEDPPLKGGCPLLNTAIDSDDTHPELRERASKAMDQWLRLLEWVIEKGIRKQEIIPETDSRSVAIYLTASIEGGVMLSKLYQDSSYMQKVIEHVHRFIDRMKKS